MTRRTLAQYRDDVAALGCLPPTEEPRATDHMPEMRALIERLVRRGVAYVAEDHVLFSPVAMDALPGAPRYGALARRSLDEMLAGARVDVAPYKRDPMDFVLWKPSKPGEPAWESPAGIAAPGRPGWHIECSAMAMKTLLTPFGGGLACEDADKQRVRHPRRRHRPGVSPPRERDRAKLLRLRHDRAWPMSGCTTASCRSKREKMSKSLGNFVTIHELLADRRVRRPRLAGRRWCGSPCCAAIIASRSTGPCARWRKRRRRWRASPASPPSAPAAPAPSEALIAALADDLNSPAALAHLHALANDGEAAQLRRDAAMLGLDIEAAIAAESAAPEIDAATRERIEALVAERLGARKAKDWAASDRLRDELGGDGRGAEGQQGRHELGDQAMSVALRPFLPADGPRCAAIFRAAIEEIASEDYSEAQCAAWAARADDEAAFAARSRRPVDAGRRARTARSPASPASRAPTTSR